MLGIDDRVGSLDPGKDADVALFSAIPALNVTARCVRTIINGKTVYAE
jgi:imidazolonepropionase-like amidohydrolase